MKLIEDKVTDTHVYFWGDPTLSNWGPAEFEYKGYQFYNSEQAFMWEKADFFGDQEIANLILQTRNPREAKDLGRKVKGYNDGEWSKVRYKKMLEVCLAKFSQNNELKQTLLSTGDKIIVEGSPYDRIWGVGWHWTDPEILYEVNWRGKNLLGKVLMEVRNTLKKEK